MSNRKASFTAILAAVLAAGTGCTLFDRESYSIAFRNPAHQYTKPPPKPELPPATEPESDFDIEADLDLPDPSTFVRHDLDAIIERAAPRLEAFLPFRYCRLHGTSHPVESVVAVAIAPIEYPLAIAGQFTYLAVDTTLAILMAPLKALLPPPEKPPSIEERKKGPVK